MEKNASAANQVACVARAITKIEKNASAARQAVFVTIVAMTLTVALVPKTLAPVLNTEALDLMAKTHVTVVCQAAIVARETLALTMALTMIPKTMTLRTMALALKARTTAAITTMANHAAAARQAAIVTRKTMALTMIPKTMTLRTMALALKAPVLRTMVDLKTMVALKALDLKDLTVETQVNQKVETQVNQKVENNLTTAIMAAEKYPLMKNSTVKQKQQERQRKIKRVMTMRRNIIPITTTIITSIIPAALFLSSLQKRTGCHSRRCVKPKNCWKSLSRREVRRKLITEIDYVTIDYITQQGSILLGKAKSF
jgi:hypothetical protein